MITSENRNELRQKLKTIEKLSGKGIRKWRKTRRKYREAYIKQITSGRTFTGCIYYSSYQNTRSYFELTILSAAKALHDRAKTFYEATVFVDGLKRSERFRFGGDLRKLKVSVKKVRGVRDESDEFIRLADAVAGFIRDGLEGDKIMRALQKEAEKRGIIKKI